ncbi:WW domain-containing oxidoreductase [Naematelia encephala]|uniref:WW domain-containing oxidoreductase n=1 Tax=Naematelia encephala TaxID=71784 RepID=A0A1Y2AZK8_9TREE|nr:WW domain-containing oxidoreductase [Naematelia encephala]
MSTFTKYDANTPGSVLVRDYAAQIAGKTVLVTGASPNSIGYYFLSAIAVADPALLIIGVRDIAKGEATAAHLKTINPNVPTRVLQIDLASFASVRKAAAEVNAYPEPLEVLVNNAGIMAVPTYTKTKDGHEIQLQVNHLSPFLFTNLLINNLVSVRGRVVNVSGIGYGLGHIRYLDYNFHDGESYDPWRAYGQSKTGPMLFALSLAEKLGSSGLQAFSANPGISATTSLGRHVTDWTTLVVYFNAHKVQGNAEGFAPWGYADNDLIVATYVLAAFSPDIVEHNGKYLEGAQVADEDTILPWALGSREARKAWALSEKLIGQKFDH